MSVVEREADLYAISQIMKRFAQVQTQKREKGKPGTNPERDLWLANTTKLLRLYRRYRWELQNVKVEICAELDKPIEELNEFFKNVDPDDSRETKFLTYRVSSLKTSKVLIDYVNESLSRLKSMPGIRYDAKSFNKGNQSPSGERLYNLLYTTYIETDNDVPLKEVFSQLQLSPRAYYRLRNRAIDELSIILWGANSPFTQAVSNILDNAKI